MDTNRASLTATGIAMLRALESEQPEPQRLICDPYARQFVPGWIYWMGRLFSRLGYAEWRGPGVQGFLAARERYIDDRLLAAVQAGIRQLVILGAGYDARAYRFADRLKAVRVFEVDQPATQAIKLKTLQRILGQRPAWVTFVAIDFNTQSLIERLPACGYDAGRQTLFIWQGVTPYLTAEAVDTTLAFVARHSAPGSAIVFDYIDRSVLEHAGRHGEVTNLRRYGRFTGESLTFGIPDGTIEAFLAQRGLTHIQFVRSRQLEQLYFSGPRQGRRVASGYGIASAVVPHPPPASRRGAPDD